MRATKVSTIFAVAAATLISLFVGVARAADDPIVRVDFYSDLYGLVPEALDSSSLYMTGSELAAEGLRRFDLKSRELKLIVRADPYADWIHDVVAHGDTVAYLLRSDAQAPKGYEAKNASKLMVTDPNGSKLRTVYRTTDLQKESSNFKNPADCGRRLLDLQLLPNRQLQVFVAEFGLKTRDGLCRRTSERFLRTRQRVRVLRFASSGKLDHSRRLNIKGDFQFGRTPGEVSGDGRFLVSDEHHRTRVIDVVSGRTRFRRHDRGSNSHFTIPGFHRSAVVFEHLSGSSENQKYEIRYFSDLFNSAHYIRVGTVQRRAISGIERCGRKFVLADGTSPKRISQIDRSGKLIDFAAVPQGESITAMTCDGQGLVTESFETGSADTILRLLPFSRAVPR